MPSEQRYVRLSDTILEAFQAAHAQKNLIVAEHLHSALELVMTRRAGKMDVERRNVAPAVLDSYDQLNELRAEAKTRKETKTDEQK